MPRYTEVSRGSFLVDGTPDFGDYLLPDAARWVIAGITIFDAYLKR